MVAWDYTAENMVEILHKGDEIMDQGRLLTEVMKGRIKVMQYVTEIVAYQL